MIHLNMFFIMVCPRRRAILSPCVSSEIDLAVVRMYTLELRFYGYARLTPRAEPRVPGDVNMDGGRDGSSVRS